MRSGANRSYQAAWLAMDAAGQLSRATVQTGIFGDFPTAAAFSAGIRDAHRDHVARLTSHSTTLGTVGDEAHRAVCGFSELEERNTEELHEVRWPTTPA